MFIEYPKALYMGGIGALYEELPHVVVNSREEEQAQNEKGWFEIGKAPSSGEEKPAKRKYTRRNTEAE